MTKRTQPATTKKKITKAKPAANTGKLVLQVSMAVLAIASLVALIVSDPNRNQQSDTADRKTAANASEGVASLNLDAARKSAAVPIKTVKIQLSADSGRENVNAVQAAIRYPADKLDFGGITEGSAFPVVLATDYQSPGVVRLARGANVGTNGVSGQQSAATLTFTIKPGAEGTITVSLDPQSSLLVRTSDSQNILGSGGSVSVDISQQ